MKILVLNSEGWLPLSEEYSESVPQELEQLVTDRKDARTVVCQWAVNRENVTELHADVIFV